MKESVKLIAIITLVFILVALSPFVIVYGVSILAGYGSVYETSDPFDYGKIIGNFDNDTPEEFIFSFFPDGIEESFENVVYHYKAKKFDAYAYEAYLEFTISDSAQFEAFLNAAVDESKCNTFQYDNSYAEFVISDVFLLEDSDSADQEHYISSAKVGSILFSREKQKFIFVAFGVHDGGGTSATELGYFFDKFNIDPAEFESHAYMSYYQQEQARRMEVNSQP